jgi:hypothetical protein
MAGTKLFLCTEVVVPVVPLSESDCVDVIGVDRYLFRYLSRYRSDTILPVRLFRERYRSVGLARLSQLATMLCSLLWRGSERAPTT